MTYQKSNEKVVLVNSLGIIGVNIHSQNLRLLEKLTIAPEERVKQVSAIKKMAALSELVYLATCNRVEFIFINSTGRPITDVRNHILDFFFRRDKNVSFDPADFFMVTGLDAVRHVFAVASSLDSMVVGEAQILGQMKEAFTFSQNHNLSGEKLAGVFQHAFKVAKKVRTETDLGKKSVSMISLIASLIDSVISSEEKPSVALVGAGKMTDKLIPFLKSRHVDDLVFVNRTKSRATALACRHGGQAMTLNDFLNCPPPVRIVCTATSSPEPIFTDKTAAQLLSGKSPVLLLDLAIPRDARFGEAARDKIEVINISDLKQAAAQNRRERFRSVDKAQGIIDGEVMSFHRSKVEERLRPIFSRSHQECREFAESGLKKLFETRLSHLGENDRNAINHWVDKLVSYAAFLPGRAVAEMIIDQENPDISRPRVASSHRRRSSKGGKHVPRTRTRRSRRESN